MLTRKGKTQIVVVPTPFHGLDSLNIFDTNRNYGGEYHPRYCEIHDIFQNEDFPSKDEDIEENWNIHKSNIHTMAPHLEHFPYNDVAIWCFSHMKNEIGLIVNSSGIVIASLNMEDIKV